MIRAVSSSSELDESFLAAFAFLGAGFSLSEESSSEELSEESSSEELSFLTGAAFAFLATGFSLSDESSESEFDETFDFLAGAAFLATGLTEDSLSLSSDELSWTIAFFLGSAAFFLGAGTSLELSSESLSTTTFFASFFDFLGAYLRSFSN